MNDQQRQGGGGNKSGNESRGGRGRRGRNNRGGKRGGGGQQPDQNKNKPNQGNSRPNPNQKQGNQTQGAPAEGGDRKKGRNRRRRGRRGGGNGGSDTILPKKPMGKVIEHIEPVTHAVMFFDTMAQAKNNLAQIIEKSKEVGVLNVVVKAEGPMTDPEILQHARLFTGEAWHLIHTRRQEEGWYDAPRPKPASAAAANDSAIAN